MKITAIVQARMGSERLPGKVLKAIINKPMILHVLDRLGKSKYIDHVILATSDSDKEIPLVNTVSNSGYDVFTGEEENVLKRYVDTVDKYGGDIIIRITGDCPFIDPQIVDNVISYYMMNDYDYVRLDVPDTFVRGLDVEVFSADILRKVYKEVSELDDKSFKEHVTLYIYRNKDKFRVKEISGGEVYNKDYRLCVDTTEDFDLVSKVYEHFDDEYVSAKEVIKFLDENPEIAQINSEVLQKKD